MVDERSNAVSEPQRKNTVLRAVETKTHRLVCVSPPPKANEEGEWIPVCKIVSKKEQYQAEKARKERSKSSKMATTDSVKTLELNWAIDLNDLGHRMKRVEEFLAEGRKVEIVLAKKKQGRVASMEECQEVLRRIKETVEGVKGAKEVKAMEGPVGGLATLLLEGPKV